MLLIVFLYGFVMAWFLNVQTYIYFLTGLAQINVNN